MNAFRIYGVVLAVWALAGDVAIAQKTSDVELAIERTETICRHLLSISDAVVSNDLVRVTSMLAHHEPWVRACVFRRLLEDTNLSEIQQRVGLPDVNAWSETNRISALVTAIQSSTEKQYAFREKMSPSKRRRIYGQSMAGVLDLLWFTATREFYQGRPEATDMLVDLLVAGTPAIQAKTLQCLIANTDFASSRKEVRQLFSGGKVDEALVAEKKSEWLAWWDANNSTFIPKKKERHFVF